MYIYKIYICIYEKIFVFKVKYSFSVLCNCRIAQASHRQSQNWIQTAC